jgi:exosome complex component MTR3
VHGPRALPRSAPYASHAALTCHVKHAPFATRRRRGLLRDAAERDLAAQLEAALRGVVLAERFPKAGIDVCVTVLEGEEDRWWGDEARGGGGGGGGGAAGVEAGVGAARSAGSPTGGGWGAMVVLAGCVTVASAALVDAGVDCVDLVTGGVAALVDPPGGGVDGEGVVVLDPNPTEHERIRAACVVGYIANRDEITLLWERGEVDTDMAERLVEEAVASAIGVREVLRDALLEDDGSKDPEELGDG